MVFLTIAFAALLQGYSFISGEDIVSVTDDAPCFKGKSHTITCEMKKRNSFVRWINENDDESIVLCIGNSCHLNSAYEREYKSSCDPFKNIFNLTILNVDLKYKGKKFVCSDGTNSACKVLNIVEYEQSLEDTGNGVITATSACSSRNKKVSFKWIKRDPDSKEEIEYKPKIIYKKVTCCSNVCENETLIKYTEAISIVSGGNGKKYYLKMKVDYGNESIMSTPTTNAYMIEEQDTKYEEELENTRDYLWFISTLAIPLALISLGFKKRKNRTRQFHTDLKRDEERTEDALSESLPFVDLERTEVGILINLDMKAVNENNEDANSIEETKDEDLCMSYKDEEATVTGIIRDSVKETCPQDQYTDNMMEKNGIAAEKNLNKGSENDANSIEEAKYEDLCMSYKDEEATITGRIRDFVKETYPHDPFTDDVMEKNGTAAENLNQGSENGILSLSQTHDISPQLLPMPDLQYSTKRNTEVESNETGSIQSIPKPVLLASTTMPPEDIPFKQII